MLVFGLSICGEYVPTITTGPSGLSSKIVLLLERFYSVSYWMVETSMTIIHFPVGILLKKWDNTQMLHKVTLYFVDLSRYMAPRLLVLVVYVHYFMFTLYQYKISHQINYSESLSHLFLLWDTVTYQE